MKSNCELCGGGEFDVVGNVDRKGNPLQTVACRRCGLISHADIPTDEQLADYYGQRYRQEYHGERTPSARRVVREWRRGRTLFEMLAGHVAAASQVLEIGAGIGCNLKHFELAGFATHGIEPGEGFLKFSQEKLHANIRAGMLAELPASHDNDLVLLVHVLEHLPDPRKSLAHIRGLLKPGGKLYVEVPNCGAPHAAPGKLFHYAHLYNFTPATLIAAGRLAGFDVEHVFSAERERNLMVLFRASQQQPSLEEEDFRAGRRQATAALGRYNTLTYHLRWRYLAERLATLVERQRERFGARRQLERILQICAEHAAGKSINRTPPAGRKRAA